MIQRMNVLVLNCGSSSIRFQIIETDADRIAAHTDRAHVRGHVEKIGTAEALVTLRFGDEAPTRHGEELLNHQAALMRVLDMVRSRELAIEAIGHRVVHGGEHLTESRLITDDVVRQIEAALPLAPLHNPHNMKGFRICEQIFPGLPQVAVFDTAFHHTLPPVAYLYGLPYDYYKRQGIRRYGFHGTSVRYVFYRYRERTGAKREQANVIVAHLGNGCSVTAIGGGHSVDTSMGFTPLEGLLMGTRCGDIDPSILLHLMAKEELMPHEVSTLLNRWSGLYGLSGNSSDMRTLLESMETGDQRSRLAVESFCYRLRKYIGAYWAALGRLDAVIFTGGIGERGYRIRELALAGLEPMGLRLSVSLNRTIEAGEGDIAAAGSPVRIWVIPTNEELLIARDTYRILNDLPLP